MNKALLFSILTTAGFDPHYAGTEQEIKFACPECQDDKDRLYMSQYSGLWICHHCKEKGNLFSFLYKYCDIGDPWATEQVVSEIRGSSKDLDLPIPRPNVKTTEEVELPKELLYAVTKDSPLSRFLIARCLDPLVCSVFSMGYCLSGRYSNRIIVPVYTRGELKTFIARTWLEGYEPKVLMPLGSKASEALFGYDDLPTKGPLIIVEGVWDALAVKGVIDSNPTAPFSGVYSYPSVVATLGAHMTDAQRRLVQQTGFSSVVLLRDGDQVGREAAIKEARELKAMMLNVKIANLPDGVDPGSASTEQIREAIQFAKPVGEDYGTESIKEGVDNG